MAPILNKKNLNKADPKAVLRLAKYLGIDAENKDIQTLISEIFDLLYPGEDNWPPIILERKW